jgi:MFS superfamily sulfate permease-like transporter
VYPIQGVALVGHIPAGLPQQTAGWWLPLQGDLPQLAVVAATVTLVGLMESIAIGKALADRTGQALDANQELLGAA